MVTIGVNAKGIGQWVVGNSEDGVTRSGAAYPLGLRLWHLLQRTDVLNDRFAPAVDVRPGTVAYAVFVAGNVDHVAAAARAGYAIMRLLYDRLHVRCHATQCHGHRNRNAGICLRCRARSRQIVDRAHARSCCYQRCGKEPARPELCLASSLAYGGASLMFSERWIPSYADSLIQNYY